MKKLIQSMMMIAMAIAAFTFSACNDDEEPLPEVTAGFTQVTDQATGTVTFTNTSENADSFSWDFGDGTTSTEMNPVKTYDMNGTFTVVLTASSVSGGSDTFESDVTINVVDDGPDFDGGLVTNGDFENGTEGWSGNALNVMTDNGNSFNFANVEEAGDAFAVNLSQVLEIEQGTTYTLSFDASSDRARTMIAGIGLNEEPFTNVSQVVELTTETQRFELTLSANSFGGANSRILFDMGAEVGVVVIDNVSLVVDPDGGGGGSGFDSGLLTNGDFESGSEPWFGNALQVRTEGGNSFNFANVEQAGDAFAVNLSQVVEITQGTTYRLTFDASSDRNRTLVAGIGLNEAPFTAAIQTIDLTTESQNFEIFLTATEFGIPNSRVLFDMGAAVGVVVIDNVSLAVDDSGEDRVAPVITLNGEAVVNLEVGDTFTDPGATAMDNVDGDISDNIAVGGDMVDTNVVGTYVITYDVSDNAGNAAATVTRTVNVSEAAPFDDGLLVNGDFENGTEGWSGNALNVMTEGGNSFNFANIEQAGDAFAVNLSQVVEIVQGSTYMLSFDASSDRNRTMLAGIGLNENPFTAVTEVVNLTTETQRFMFEFTATDFGIPNSRVLFDMGADVGVVVIDNVSLMLVSSGGGGGGGGGAGDAIFEQQFNDAAAINGWTVVGAPDASEVDISFSENGGNDGGAIQLMGTNPSTDGRGYVFEFEATGLNYGGASNVTVTFDARLVGALTATAIHVRTNIPGPGFMENFDIQNDGLNGDSFTSYTFNFSNVASDASTFRFGFTMAAGAVEGAGGTLLIDNIRLTASE